MVEEQHVNEDPRVDSQARVSNAERLIRAVVGNDRVVQALAATGGQSFSTMQVVETRDR